MHGQTRGFSLLEMSIVIVIVGLVAGVVIASQALMRQSELRAITADAVTYAMAMQDFKTKYQALPGDIPNATNFWGVITGGASACMGTQPESTANSQLTCNGNGNGFIEANSCEQYRAWQHLKSAGFIQGNYSGVSGGGGCGNNSVPGVNVPVSKREGAGFSLFSAYPALVFPAVGLGMPFTNNSSGLYYDGDYNNAMVFGARYEGNYTMGAALLTREARQVDEKFDDGSPKTGSIRSLRNDVAPTKKCVNGSDLYDESFKDPACSLIFTNSFKRKTTAY